MSDELALDSCLNSSPHPSPLPLGEGEAMDRLRFRTTVRSILSQVFGQTAARGLTALPLIFQRLLTSSPTANYRVA